VYVEHHEIKKGQKSLITAEGKPVTKKMLRDIALASQEDKMTSSATTINLLPTNVLLYDARAGKHVVAWFEKQQIRTMKFRDEDTNKTSSRPVPLPAILFVANGEELSVYSMKTGNGRPALSTPLFCAPVPNVYSDARVCMGDILCPKEIDDIQLLIEAWSNAFWKGRFTVEMATVSKTPLDKLYPKLRKAKTFPVTEMINAGPTNIKNLLKTL
jgi:PRTRC genetic system protein B